MALVDFIDIMMSSSMVRLTCSAVNEENLCPLPDDALGSPPNGPLAKAGTDFIQGLLEGRVPPLG